MKKNQSDKRFLLVVTTVLLLLVIVGSVTFAWLAGSGTVPSSLVDASVLTQYFHCGTGTAEDPFVITRPVHYFNLVYLYQRKEGFCDQGYYFQLGYDLTGNDGALEVYDYNADGSINEGVYSSQLNLACYSGDNALLPIGTSTTPFIGTFNGSGLTVKNLNIKSIETINGVTYKTCDVGIFGYVSGIEDVNGKEINGSILNTFFENINIDLTGSDPSAECHGKASVHYVRSDVQDTVFVGYLAGHIKTSSMMENVYVNNCTITGGGAFSDSEFGYFGVVEDSSTGEMVTALGDRIATLRTAGNGAGFGGSLDMKAMFTRIQDVLDNNGHGGINRVQTYPTTESIVMPSDSVSKPTVTFDATGNIGKSDYGDVYRWQTATAGSYIGSISDNYSYLYSLKPAQTTQASLWTQTGEQVPAWLIDNEGKYLCTLGTNITNAVTTEANAKKWLHDSNNHWYTIINNKTYYLNANNNATGILLSDGTAQSASVWYQGTDGSFYTTIGGRDYYLIYTGGVWSLSPTKESYSISDGKGHFLTGSRTGVGNVSQASDSVFWQITDNGSTVNIYAILDGTTYYLGYNGGLTMTATSTAWTKDGNGYYVTVGGQHLYLIYNNGWRAELLEGFKIHSGDHQYLSATLAGGVQNEEVEDSTTWLFSSPTGDTTISTVAGTAVYYLGYNGNFGLSFTTTPTTWHRDGTNSFYVTQGGVNYYLQCSSNAWCALPLRYHVISDGNGNYLRATGINGFSNTTVEAEATRFYFSDSTTPSGTIRYFLGGASHYLGRNNSNFSDTATSWTYSDGAFHDGIYYLGFDGQDWKITNRAYQFYITDGKGRYLTANGTTLTVVSNPADLSSITKWDFSNTSNLNSPSGTVSTTINDRLYYLRVNYDRGGCGDEDDTYTLQFNTTNSNNSWTINNNKLRSSSYTSYYLDISGTTPSVNTTGTTLASPLPHVQNLDGTALTATAKTATVPSLILDTVAQTIPAISITGPIEKDVTVTLTETTETLYAQQPSDTYRRGTYIPIRVNQEDENYAGTDDYGVSDKNTGYIIGGTYSEKSGSGQGDIRVSMYSNTIANSYSGGNFTHLYTFDGSGTTAVEIGSENEFTQLESVKSKFKDLQGTSTSVYGLHFMDSAISKNHVIQAEIATVLGKTYVNYDLPESCIDFNLVEKGYITFLAGDYYSGNNAFFSLHQVFRNDDQTISAIKEIKRIYKKTGDEFAPYLYVYVGEESTTTVPSGYELVFDTALITNPRNGTQLGANSWIYYFEIPCNSGEYALGSVSGKTGAYLLYLDIGSNGGAVVESIVNPEGNSETDMLNVEYRFNSDTDIPLDHSILQFAFNVPESATTSNFSVNVVFDRSKTGDALVSCPKGCYVISIVNKTNEDIRLQVFLCDNDNDMTNSFDYAYQIVYTNTNKTEQTLNRLVGSSEYSYWKAVAGFTIPNSGTASEMTYTSSS